MTFAEFVDFMETNLSNVPVYYEHALAEEQRKNHNRQSARRWNDTRLARAVDKLWATQLETIFNTIRSRIKTDKMDPAKPWLDFIAQYNVIESFDENIPEINFNSSEEF